MSRGVRPGSGQRPLRSLFNRQPLEISTHISVEYVWNVIVVYGNIYEISMECNSGFIVVHSGDIVDIWWIYSGYMVDIYIYI